MKSNLLSDQELSRYNRHIIIPEFGVESQEKLKQTKVLIVGVGGLGSASSRYLAAAGIGEIGLVDDDVVSDSNLQRQVLYGTSNLGQSKATIAKQVLENQNPYIKINTYNCRLTSKNASEIIANYDIVVDGTDNFETRYLINDTCVELNKIYVFGSIFEFEGQVSVFNYNDGPTYRCLYPESPTQPNPEETPAIGVIGVLPSIIGSLQANEVIKIASAVGEPLSGKLFVINLKDLSNYTLSIKKDIPLQSS